MEGDMSTHQEYKSAVKGLSLRKRTIFHLIEEYKSLTSQEIAKKMVLPINCITGRIRELYLMRLIRRKRLKNVNTSWVINSSDVREIEIKKDKLVYLLKIRDLQNDINNCISEVSKDQLRGEIKRIKTKLKFIK